MRGRSEIRFRFHVHIFGVFRDKPFSPCNMHMFHCASLSASVFRAMDRG